MQTCSSCGAETRSNRFCERCGAALATVVQGGPPLWTEADMDKSVVKAVRKRDVQQLVHLAKYSRELDKSPRGDAICAQAIQVLLAMVGGLDAALNVKDLTYILVNLESADELSAVSEATIDALVAAGPDGIREVVSGTGKAASKLYAAEALRRVGDDDDADVLVADVEAMRRTAAGERALSLGRAEYLGGCSGWGPARVGTLSMTSTQVLFDEKALTQCSSIASIEVGGGQVAKSRLAATIAFGAVGLGARAAQDRGELVLHLVSGESAFFFIVKKSATAIRAALSPLLRTAGVPFKDEADHQAMVAAASGASTSPSLADELLKLAKLQESGFLTADELAAAKAKLLG
jgi:hypothetical protein